MNSSLNNMRNNNLKEGKLLNAGLSVSNQSLNDTSEFKNGVREEGIPRSGSLPEINQSDNLEDWQATRTTKVCDYLISFRLFFSYFRVLRMVMYHANEIEAKEK